VDIMSWKDKFPTQSRYFETTNGIFYNSNVMEQLKQFPSETFDMVFIDPPYFLQLPKKQLKRWNTDTVVDGVNDE